MKTRLRQWLLSSDVQIDAGVHKGAVLGWSGGDPFDRFIYPEVCGYYLTWLASLADRFPDWRERAGAHALYLVAWLERNDAPPWGPLTRIYLHAPRDDWRNLATFTFDTGMLLRGLVDAAETWPELLRIDLVRRYHNRLADTAVDGILGSHRLRPTAGNLALPRRWSTLPGPHHVKVAAAILKALRFDPRQKLETLARTTISHWLEAAVKERPSNEQHAIYYFIEGLIQVGLIDETPLLITGAASIYRQLPSPLELAGATQRAMSDGTKTRPDVVAQFLRTGTILAAHGEMLDATAYERMSEAAAFLRRVEAPAGGVPHVVTDAEPDDRRNVWAGMFAEQALSWWEMMESKSRTLPAFDKIV